MSKLNQWLTLVANVSVVVGIVFLAVEMRQNTDMMRAQTRDAMTEKQMMWYEWIGTNREAADAFDRGTALGLAALEGADRRMFFFQSLGNFREWENSHYQYEQGLYSETEFEARSSAWTSAMRSSRGYRDIWASNREQFSPSFRTQIDRIVAEVEQAQ